jgi:hypothetical protein
MDSLRIVPYFTAAYLIFSTPLSITGESIDCIEVNGTDILIQERHKANRADHFLGKLTMEDLLKTLQNQYFPFHDSIANRFTGT